MDIQKLHEAIMEQPKDYDLRLIYADALEESGDGERAEFIKVQFELGKLLEGTDKIHWDSLDMILDPQSSEDQIWKHKVYKNRNRGNHLLDSISSKETPIRSNRYHWCGKTLYECYCSPTDGTKGPTPGWNYSCGFVEKIWCTQRDWEDYGPRIVREVPVLEVKLYNKYPIATGVDNTTLPELPTTLYRFFSNRLPQIQLPACIPDNIYKLMVGYEETVCQMTRWKLWRTEKDAKKSLSDACLLWAKQQSV